MTLLAYVLAGQIIASSLNGSNTLMETPYVFTLGPTPTPEAKLYVKADSYPAQQYQLWKDSNPTDANVMLKLSRQPQAIWISDESALNTLPTQLKQAANLQTLPVVVAYNIPLRNCDVNNPEGLKSFGEYKLWVDKLISVIGSQSVWLIVEPDALATMDCLTDLQKKERVDSILYLVSQANKPTIQTYIDVGHAKWMPADVAAARLTMAGISNARGFSLNVSNFQTTEDNVRYGNSVSQFLGGKRFVVDTSRNGKGPTDTNEWCNPRGRALGNLPTLSTGQALVDAYLWIKPPGESDGTCNNGPKAGDWWPEYALELARNAGWK